MKARYVVDTNVLIAASAGDPIHPSDIDATPGDPALRLEVWRWLDEFQRCSARLILDHSGNIYKEYCQKLSYNDFGIQVIMYKWSTAAVDDVEVLFDADGHGILPESLNSTVHDNADKKMVAAAIASHASFGEGWVAFAGDTDWHAWEEKLLEHNVRLEPIIEEWSRMKYEEKQNR